MAGTTFSAVGATLALLLCAAFAPAESAHTTAPSGASHDGISNDDVQFVYGGENSAVPPGVTGASSTFPASLPWTALLLPLVVGLGVIEATLLHATVLLLAGSYKGRLGRLGAWLPTVATLLALAWAAQVALLAGLLAVCLRMRTALLNGGGGDGFSAFAVSLQDVYALEPIMYATPIVAFIYWTILTVNNKIKKAKMKQMSIAVISEAAVLKPEAT